MSDIAAREMTATEWAERLVGKSSEEIAFALSSAESRGISRGLNAMRGAADHFEVAYRYAVNASKPGADAQDLLSSAETFARIGYAALSANLKT